METQQSLLRRFPSKRDAWIIAVIWLGVGLAVSGGIAQFSSAGPLLLKQTILAGLLAGAALMLWVLYGTAYTITSDEVRARSGPFRFRVPLAEIDSVVPSQNPLSSPACSLDRLEIRYRRGRRRILISPRDKAGFLQALLRVCPQLSSQGDRLVRKGSA